MYNLKTARVSNKDVLFQITNVDKNLVGEILYDRKTEVIKIIWSYNLNYKRSNLINIARQKALKTLPS